jgi:hypothetical protein
VNRRCWRHRKYLLGVGVAITAAALGTSWAVGRSGPSACAPQVHEPIDSRSTQHLLPGVPDPAFSTDPPTSGPHRIGNHPSGVLLQPMARSIQVSLLERGLVLVQYKGLRSADRTRAEHLSGPTVTVAPDPDLPAPVVVTAWTYKLTCQRLDVSAIRSFVKAHAGTGLNLP